MSEVLQTASTAQNIPDDQPGWKLLSACIHCGLCLNHCPTYRALGSELDSPRGRIYQMVQVREGKLAIGDSFATHIDRCLGCLACETACPSGVKYGQIIERTRAQLEHNYRRPLRARLFRNFFYRRVLPSYSLLARLARMLRIYQRSGVQKALRASGTLKLLGASDLDRLSPAIDSDFFFGEIGKVFPAAGARRGTVALVAGCISNVAFSDLNRATIRVLNQNGIEVHVPAGQGCCGALHAHAGYREEARQLARKNLEVFLDGRFDAIVTNAAGCGSHLKDYHDLLAADSQFAGRAAEFSAKVRDISEYLAQIGLRAPRRRSAMKVAFQDPCHLLHAQKIRSAPRELLTAIGCELVELPHADQCCGSAGVYNVAENELSMKVLAAKMDDVSVVAGRIQMLVTANVGCMIQMRAGVAQRGMALPVKHVVELLDLAYQPEQQAAET